MKAAKLIATTTICMLMDWKSPSLSLTTVPEPRHIYAPVYWTSPLENLSPKYIPNSTSFPDPYRRKQSSSGIHNPGNGTKKATQLIKSGKTTDQISKIPRSLWQYLWGVEGGRNHWCYSTDTGAECGLGPARKAAVWSHVGTNLLFWIYSWPGLLENMCFLSLSKELNSLCDIFDLRFVSWRLNEGRCGKTMLSSRGLFKSADESLGVSLRKPWDWKYRNVSIWTLSFLSCIGYLTANILFHRLAKVAFQPPMYFCSVFHHRTLTVSNLFPLFHWHSLMSRRGNKTSSREKIKSAFAVQNFNAFPPLR